MPAAPCVATFHATYAVLKAEKILKGLGLKVKLIPVPRQISSNCGISLRFDCADLERVKPAITSLSEDLEGIFRQDEARSYTRL